MNIISIYVCIYIYLHITPAWMRTQCTTHTSFWGMRVYIWTCMWYVCKDIYVYVYIYIYIHMHIVTPVWMMQILCIAPYIIKREREERERERERERVRMLRITPQVISKKREGQEDLYVHIYKLMYIYIYHITYMYMHINIYIYIYTYIFICIHEYT